MRPVLSKTFQVLFITEFNDRALKKVKKELEREKITFELGRAVDVRKHQGVNEKRKIMI